jgi:diacylglycerol kinase family enzyme
MLGATLTALHRFPLWRVRVTVDGRALDRTTPFVFVGNNEYQESFLGLRGRSRLDAGVLSLYLPRTGSRRGLLRLALLALAGQLDRAEDFQASCASEIRVESRRRMLRLALDGEVLRLEPPLVYRVLPRALPVLAHGPRP